MPVITAYFELLVMSLCTTVFLSFRTRKNDSYPTFNSTVAKSSRSPSKLPTIGLSNISSSIPLSNSPSRLIFGSTRVPTTFPTIAPMMRTSSKLPTNGPSSIPSSLFPSLRPSTVISSRNPSTKPVAPSTKVPSMVPTTISPTTVSSNIPSNSPVTSNPSSRKPSDTRFPSKSPSKLPTNGPSSIPSSLYPSPRPFKVLSSLNPSSKPVAHAPPLLITSTKVPSMVPNIVPSEEPSFAPSETSNPSTIIPSNTQSPTRRPTRRPTSKRPTSRKPTKIPTNRPTTSKPLTKPTINPSYIPTTVKSLGFRYWLLDDLYTARSCDYLCGILSTIVTVVCSADIGSFSWPHSTADLAGIYSGPNVTSRVGITISGSFDLIPFPSQPKFVVSGDPSGPQPFPFYCANSNTFAYSGTTRAGSCNATVLNSQAVAAGCTNTKRSGRLCPCLSPVSLH